MNCDDIDRGHQHRHGCRTPYQHRHGARHRRNDRAEEDPLCQAEESVVQAASGVGTVTSIVLLLFSDVCWKGKQSIVKTILARLRSESAKVEALKENIRMRVLGLG